MIDIYSTASVYKTGVHHLTIDDFPIAYDLLRPYFDEDASWSNGSKFSPENSAAYLVSVLMADTVKVLGYFEEGLKGLSVIEFCYEFRECEEAYIPMFYISPEARGNGAGRALAKASFDLCMERGVGTITTAATAIFHGDNGKLYDNLFAKFGFEPVSRVMMWRK